MGYEKFEREFPCPCGQGIQVAEFEEHDTWVSGNEAATYTLKCPQCAERFTHFYHGVESWVLKSDKERIDGLEQQIRATETKVNVLLENLVKQHEQSWVDYINHLRNRTEKKSALRGGRGFLHQALDPSFVEAEARAKIKNDPQLVYRAMKLHDAEIEGLSASRQRLIEEKRALEGSIEKIPVPDKRLGFKRR
jgi:hypothetical protein